MDVESSYDLATGDCFFCFVLFFPKTEEVYSSQLNSGNSVYLKTKIPYHILKPRSMHLKL